ncbi:type II toxin-antitoxin system RelE/ParE family toxin [Kitasatospora sp. NPDC058201]|uniref:type II toxin-antitoxin system RelE/ParE family toxin n=2 Tax=Streptomycetaceae TaxID=2062 RepID=UPI003662042C
MPNEPYTYRLVLEPEVREWLHGLRRTDRVSLDQVAAAITALRRVGPALGRPLVDRIRHSGIPNLKELRPGSSGGTEVRLLFVLDPGRRIVVLVAGDKRGRWQSWYRTAIPLAEERYRRYLRRTEERTDR